MHWGEPPSITNDNDSSTIGKEVNHRTKWASSHHITLISHHISPSSPKKNDQSSAVLHKSINPRPNGPTIPKSGSRWVLIARTTIHQGSDWWCESGQAPVSRGSLNRERWLTHLKRVNDGFSMFFMGFFAGDIWWEICPFFLVWSCSDWMIGNGWWMVKAIVGDTCLAHLDEKVGYNPSCK